MEKPRDSRGSADANTRSPEKNAMTRGSDENLVGASASAKENRTAKMPPLPNPAPGAASSARLGRGRREARPARPAQRTGIFPVHALFRDAPPRRRTFRAWGRERPSGSFGVTFGTAARAGPMGRGSAREAAAVPGRALRGAAPPIAGWWPPRASASVRRNGRRCQDPPGTRASSHAQRLRRGASAFSALSACPSSSS
jgi:hypothetical protein